MLKAMILQNLLLLFSFCFAAVLAGDMHTNAPIVTKARINETSKKTIVPGFHKPSFSRIAESFHSNAPLDLRGGGSSVEGGKGRALFKHALFVAQLATVFAIVEGFVAMVAPGACFDAFGIADDPAAKSAVALLWIESFGAAMLSIGLAGWRLFVYPPSNPTNAMDYYDAIGWSTLPFILENGRVVWKNFDSHHWTATLGDTVPLFLTIAAFFACQSHVRYLDVFVKAVGIFAVLTSALYGWNPQGGTTLFGFPEPSPTDLVFLQGGCAVCVGGGVLWLALAMGLDPFRAFGYAWIPGLLQGLGQVMIQSNGTTKTTLPMLMSILFQMVVVTTLAFSKK
jgi:hypothetical protein